MLDTANMKDAPLLGIPSMSPVWSTFFSLHVTAESTPDLSTIPDDDPFAFDTSATPRLSLRHQATFSPDSSVMADDDPPQFCPLYFSFCRPFDRGRVFVSYMGSGCLDPSIVRHICFDLFQHTKKTDGELAYAFDLLVGINNLKERHYEQVEKDNPLSIKRREEDNLSKTDEQVDKDDPMSTKSTKRSEEDGLLKTDGKSIPIRHKIDNEINPLIAIDKHGERHCEVLQHKEPHWVTETLLSYQRLLSPNILICL